MPRFFHPLLMILANATQRELAAQIQYLKAENEILRARLPKRVTVTQRERVRLVRLGTRAGKAIKELITIVTYRTFQRWAAAMKKDQTKSPSQAKAKPKPGRPRTPAEVQELILKLARETGWGYTRILGELKKLGIRNVGKTTVRNILKAAGLDPDPNRGNKTWDNFLRIHAQTLWACDFVSKKVWTLGGLVEHFVLVFIHVKSRQVIATAGTVHPTGQWVAQQARNFILDAEAMGMGISHLIHDMDTKFMAHFDGILESEGVSIHKVGPMKPNLNAYIERFIQTLKQECLDHFVVLGDKHLNHIVNEFVEHYNTERPHMGIDGIPRSGASPSAMEGGIECRERLGGLLRHYHRVAA